MLSNVKVLGFDADDTLWDNETFFRDAEKTFTQLLAEFRNEEEILKLLFKIEMQNLDRYGYGIKSFVLSMIETASAICDNNLPGHITTQILDIGKHMLEKPVKLLDYVEDTLQQLQNNYTIILATKGDLLDQYRKLEKSGLTEYFNHIEIMPDKSAADYKRLFSNVKTSPNDFFMTGNSVKSDILPVLELGGYAMHVPYHTTWQHEKADENITSPRFYKGKTLADVVDVVMQ